MNEILIKRIAKKPTYTIGRLYINKEYICDTIEDTDRGLDDSMEVTEIKKKKVYAETAIPTGTYKLVTNVVSPGMGSKSWAKTYKGKVPRILNVKGFEGILIHPGNTEKDSAGCIIVGENKVVGKVINSVATYNKLCNILMKESTWKITII